VMYPQIVQGLSRRLKLIDVVLAEDAEALPAAGTLQLPDAIEGD
jgi:hypothetical protein